MSLALLLVAAVVALIALAFATEAADDWSAAPLHSSYRRWRWEGLISVALMTLALVAALAAGLLWRGP